MWITKSFSLWAAPGSSWSGLGKLETDTAKEKGAAEKLAKSEKEEQELKIAEDRLVTRLGGTDTDEEDEEGVKRWTDDSPLLFSTAWLVGKGHKGLSYNFVDQYPCWGWSNPTPTLVDRPTQLICISDIHLLSTYKYKRHSRAICYSSTYPRPVSLLVNWSVSNTFRFPLCRCLWTITEHSSGDVIYFQKAMTSSFHIFIKGWTNLVGWGGVGWWGGPTFPQFFPTLL